MNFFLTFCLWLEQTSVGTHMRQSNWLFPAVESMHIVAGTVPLVTATSLLSARLMGWGLRDISVSRLAAAVLPWAWAGFVIQLVTGILLFSSSATKYSATHIFYIKMILIVLAGINALIFNRTAYRRISAWDDAPTAPRGAKLMGALSFVLWLGVVVMGRVLNSAATLVP